jgi:hypothetical protein
VKKLIKLVIWAYEAPQNFLGMILGFVFCLVPITLFLWDKLMMKGTALIRFVSDAVVCVFAFLIILTVYRTKYYLRC